MLEFAGSLEKVEREFNNHSVKIEEETDKLFLNNFKNKIEF